MKATNIEKLYDKLTIQERARMTFEALCFNDKDTANKITKSVPRHHYEATDLDFRKPLDNYFQVASIWAVEYWKSYCKMLAAIGLEDSELESFWESRLISLGLILRALEKSHGIKPATILHFSGAGTDYGLGFEPDHLEGDALEYYEMCLAQFLAFIDDSQVPPEVDAYFVNDIRGAHTISH